MSEPSNNFEILAAEDFLTDLGFESDEGPEGLAEEEVQDFELIAEDFREALPFEAAGALCAATLFLQRANLYPKTCARWLESVGAFGGPIGHWYLREFSRLPGTGLLGQLAESLVGRLKRAGSVALIPHFGKLSDIYVSGVAGSGHQLLNLGVKDEDLRFVFTLHASQGITSFSPLRWQQDVLMKDPKIRWAPCDLDTARSLVADTLISHQDGRFPPPGRFLLARPLLGAKAIVARPWQPPLDAYDEPRSLDFKLVERSAELMRDMMYGGFLFFSQDLFDDLNLRYPEGEGAGEFSDDEYRAFLQNLGEHERQRFLKLLGSNLAVEAMAGEEKRLRNRRAFKVFWAIREGFPFEDVPYIRELCGASWMSILGKLQEGFTSESAYLERMTREMEPPFPDSPFE